MDYEKKLKDALDDKLVPVEVQEWIEDNFPELVESEDERIRKDLIKFIKGCGAYSQEYVDWLEKLGDQDNNEDSNILQRFSFYSYKDEPNILYLSSLYVNEEYRNKGIGTKILEVADEVAKSLDCHAIRLKTKKDSNAERLYQTHGYNSLAIEEKDEIWFEKPCEQKPQGKSALEAAKEEKVDNQNCTKPANKIEPKFRIEKGKWYVCTNTFVSRGKIIAIKGQTYQSQQEDDTITCEDKCLFIDRHDGKASDYFRYWTIQDAKDGDILRIRNLTFIFEEITNDNVCHKDAVVAYCSYEDNDNSFGICGPDCITDLEIITPATKEQRDILFAKMEEFGYEWDAEKKKLKKIEQKSVDIPKDFEKYVEHLLSLSDGEGHGSPAKVKEVSSELLRLANRQKIVWSEEDEKTLNAIALFLSSIDYLEDPETWINWFKSLKDRITLLPIEEVLTKVGLKPYKDGDQWCILLGDNIQEGICGFGNTVEDALYAFLKDLITSQSEQKPTTWSEEDEKVIHLACEFIRHRTNEFNNGGSISGMDYKTLYKKLKSIRSQSTWKPSEAQMVVLNDIIINGHLSNANERILKGLQEQLKKLMGNSYESKH